VPWVAREPFPAASGWKGLRARALEGVIVAYVQHADFAQPPLAWNTSRTVRKMILVSSQILQFSM
jgi:hypothetical protein